LKKSTIYITTGSWGTVINSTLGLFAGVLDSPVKLMVILI